MSTQLSPTTALEHSSFPEPFLLHEALMYLNGRAALDQPLLQPAEQETPGNHLPQQKGRRQDSLKELLCQNLFNLISLLKSKDFELYQHSLRVQYLSRRLLQTLALSGEETVKIELAALFHDIGKITLPDKVLHKPSRLTSQEFEKVKAHCARGAHILSRMRILDGVAHVVYHHHEHWDGFGYPSGLAGEAIPLGARIVAIADAFEVMTSGRVYQTRRTPVQALEELWRCAGTQFDTALVNRFCASLILH